MTINTKIFVNPKQILFLFLLLLVLVLPNLEAPKNLFFLGFFLTWFVYSYKSNDFGGDWKILDTLFLIWIIIDIMAGLNALISHAQPFKGSFDLLRYLTFGWLMSRIAFKVELIKKIVIFSGISILPIFFMMISSDCYYGQCLMLNSVGHVNHTAIYIVLVVNILTAYFLGNISKMKNFELISFISLIILYSALVVLTNSRAATGLLFFNFLFFLIYSYKELHKKNFLIIASSFAIFVLSVFVFKAPVIDRFYEGFTSKVISTRERINNFSYELVKIDPILGTGLGNYPNFGLKDIKARLIQSNGEKWWDSNKGKFVAYVHPHNIYFYMLTGGGILLLLSFVIFFLYFFMALFKTSFKAKFSWINIAAFNISLVILGIGFVNTSLAHENALLSFMIIGIYFSNLRFKNIQIK